MLYLIVSAGALAGVWLNIKKNPLCFPIWSVTNATWAAVDWAQGLYARSALMAVYSALAVYGAWAWRREKRGGG